MVVPAPENGLSADANIQTAEIDCKGRNQQHDPERFEPVAIIGMAMRLPGRVKNEKDFWNLLSEKKSGLCDIPQNRLNVHGFYDTSGMPGTIMVDKGYYLEDIDIQQFDTSVFSVSKKELEHMDPLQRQLLQVAYECFESAGVCSWRGSNTGCYIGEFGEDWHDLNAKETQHRSSYRATGFSDFALSNRISYEFDLHGPSMTIKTACSSAMVGLDLACKAIQKRECDSALVGGINLMISPATWMLLNDMGVLSPRGQSRTFDAGADGYGRGEGVNMILVKRLSHALRDNDPIRAIIRGTGVNSDGRTQGLFTPNPVAQAALIRHTYAAAGIQDLSETAVVECHGTGTPVGDPLEAEAIADCFGEAGMVITSVKPSVGHTEGGAGLTSLIKMVLVLEHRQVVPNLNFETPNPKIRFKERGLHVPTELEPWPEGRADRVSVNSFGVAGVNAHAILESPRQFGIASQSDIDLSKSDVVVVDGFAVTRDSPAHVFLLTSQLTSNAHLDNNLADIDDAVTNDHFTKGPLTNGSEANGYSINGASANGTVDTHVVGQKVPASLLLLSAYSTEALRGQIDALQEYTKNKNSVAVRDVGYTLANRREHRSHRAFAITSGNGSSFQVSDSHALKDWPVPTSTSGTKTVWVFTGQAAQWPAMGADLLDTNTTFRKTIEKLDKFLQSMPTPPSWKIEHELRKGPVDSRVHRAEFGHPMCVALQVALVDVLRSWGIVPEVIVGHSSGEIAAAYASGGISAEEAMAIAAYRGHFDVLVSEKGTMAAVGLGRHDVLPYLVPGVTIACENSQSSSTLSGDVDAVEMVVRMIKTDRPEELARLLRVERAYHSPHMLPYGEPYEEHVKPYVSSRDPTTPLYSSVTGKRITGDGCLDAHYWRANMVQPVLFNTALRSAISNALPGSDNVALIEIGPHQALASPISQILSDIGRSNQISYNGSLVRGKSSHESLMSLAGKLYQQGVSLDYSVLCPLGNFVRDLPRYSWKQDTTHWAEPRVSREWRFRENLPHALLGSRVLEMTATEPTWRKSFALEDVLWLTGHEVNGQFVFPAAGYISMVGEALEQLHGATSDSCEAGYSIKNVHITSARVLEMDKTVELITSLKPIMLDATEATPWYQFTITSFDGTRWARNCFGEARASKDKSSVTTSRVALRNAPFPRDVDAESWYNGLRRNGFNYTGLFEGMRDVSAATTTTEAKAIVDPERSGETRSSRYVLHPATIDQCFQLFTVAAFRGVKRNMRQLSVPTFIEEMTLSPCPAKQALDVTASVRNILERGSFTGDLVAQVAENDQQTASICIDLKGFKTSVLNGSDDDGEGEAEAPIISQLEWRPHCDFADLGSCFRRSVSRVDAWPLLEELTLLCMIDHGENITTSGETAEHLVKFFNWMPRQVERYKLGFNKFAPKELCLENNTPDQRRQRIDEIHAIMSHSPYAVYASATQKLFLAAPAIFNGDTHPLHVLLENDLLTHFYEAGTLDSGDLIGLLANTNPHMRILEVGAGTGSSTARALPALTSTYGERLYSSYTYTDVSTGLIPAAKERFAKYTAIDYAVLDVTVDPVEQGFQLGTYDLIIAANVLHATPCLKETLGNMRSLLSPGGRLFLEELTPEMMLVNYVMGFLPGWWLGAEDNRADQPFISPERWTQELIDAGFAKPDAIILDDSTPYQVNAGIVVSRDGLESALSRVSLLCYDPDGPYVSEMRDSLHALDVAADIYRLGQPLDPNKDVISLLDLQEPVLHDISEETFETVRGYLCSHKALFVWALPASQIGDIRDPRAAMTLGFTRTARNELSIPLLTVEVDEATTSASTAAGAIAKIARRARSECITKHEYLNPDYEYVVVNGKVLIPRVHWQTMSAAFQSTQLTDEDKTEASTICWRLDIETPGLLHTMMWTKDKSGSPKEGEVLIETRAVGLNFRDVLIAMGVLEESPSEMGFEGSGVVRALGPGVAQFSIGDRVMFIGSGCFRTVHIKDASLCVKMDDSMSFEQAAAQPCVYATALMALVDEANLQRGQSVLIHAACGGVGLAAIQIAQLLGAEIYCTVGSEAKRVYLTANHGIPSTHIFNSRDSSFLPDVLKVTDGRGVDVVLNSLSGDLLQASWQCVAEFGTMVEIGKRDFRRRASLAMAPFEANRTFVGLDLDCLVRLRPRRATKLLLRCVEWLREGRIANLTVSHTFPAGKLQEALRTMQTARHIGKIVVTMPCGSDGDDVQELLSVDKYRLAESQASTYQFKSDCTYLLVGGLGGIGRAIASWMVENGARSLIFLSRSAREGPATNGFIRDLLSQGCRVDLVDGSVTNKVDVARAVNKATSSMPLAGVINISTVLRDVGLREMTFADWNTTVGPKVRGTWQLHDAIPHEDQLDFFVLISSSCGIMGHLGQANYTAANTFLDAFVRFRHRRGLVASVIDLGVMGDVGFVAENQRLLGNFDNFDCFDMRIIREKNMLDALVLALQRSRAVPGSASSGGDEDETAGNTTYKNPSQIIVGLSSTTSIFSPLNRVPWRHDIRMSIYHNLTGPGGAGFGTDGHGKDKAHSSSLRLILQATADDAEKTAVIMQALTSALAAFLIKNEDEIPLDRPLELIGMDSLVAMEVRNWIRQQVGAEMSTISILQSPSVLHLAEDIKAALGKRAGAATGPGS